MKSFSFYLTALIVCIVVLSCSSVPAAKPGAPETESGQTSGDYLGEGVKICGIRLFDWMGTLYTVPFYPCEIIVPPSSETKNEAHVRPTIRVSDTTETEFWTPYVLDTRPVDKDALETDMLILVSGDTSPRSEETLKSVRWTLVQVKDLSNMFKSIVTVQYFDSYWNEWKSFDVHVQNIRMIDGEISTDL